MRIGEVAELTGLNVSNIRFYERKGLLVPDRKEDSNYRDYTEEDVIRIKQILLYRKIGISVETIYLLLNGQADLQDVFHRQKMELESQIENLQGSLDLCNLIIREQTMDHGKLDQYLNYVHEEETKGKQFAEIGELMEDMADFSKISAFRGDPYMGLMFQNPWTARIISAAIWLLLFSLPMEELLSAVLAKEPFSILKFTLFGILFVLYHVDFLNFRRAKKKASTERK